MPQSELRTGAASLADGRRTPWTQLVFSGATYGPNSFFPYISCGFQRWTQLVVGVLYTLALSIYELGP